MFQCLTDPAERVPMPKNDKNGSTRILDKEFRKIIEKVRGHPELNQGPLDLQSNALPLSYIPAVFTDLFFI